MDTIRQDLRWAIRSLAGAPLFTAVALVSLGLGIGVNGAIFSIADRTVLEPLPAVTDADRLVVVEPGSNSHAAFTDLRAASTFEAAAVATRTMSLRSGEGTELVDVQVVSGEYFGVVGVAARAGRLLAPADDRPDASPAIVLAHETARARFGERSPVGETIRLNGGTFTVVGVAEPGFRGARLGARPFGWG